MIIKVEIARPCTFEKVPGVQFVVLSSLSLPGVELNELIERFIVHQAM